MTGKELPKVIDKSQADIDAAIDAIQSTDLSPATKEFAISCIRLAVWLPKALLEQKIKLSNLRKLIFGQGRRNRSKPDKGGGGDKPPTKTKSADPEPQANDIETAPVVPAATEPSAPTNCAKRQGHGRLPYSAYTNAIEHSLAIADFNVGDLCPENCGGKLYRYEPGVLVRVKGQNLAAVHKYWVEKLRCATCGYLVSADVPADVGTEKYDAAFKSVLALQKYYVAVPFNRQSYFQSLLQMPLPVSTQWQLIEEVGSVAIPVLQVLERKAANGDTIHNDDSHVKITDLIHLNRKEPPKERTGMFTTGILSRTGKYDIALFYNGTQHAGENLENLLKKRDPNNPPVIQMCDALSRNIPASFKTILCNCLSHGLRKFDDLKDFYPEPCLHIIKQIADVYEHDEKTKAMDKEARLSFHQEHSKPIMKSLEEYIKHQLDTKQVEPNDSLGVAMRYMLNHWHELTQFLRTWLFYKTQYGAMIGGVLTSVIYTCALAGINPLTYLTVLQENKNQVVKEPERWLPWNYQDSLISVLASAA